MSFDEQAKDWDTERRINRAKIISEEISKSIGDGKGLAAMDFGCGTGLISFNLCDRFNSITLIDSSKGMIETLKDKIQNSNINNMAATQLDLAGGDTMHDTFDAIYSSMVLHHIKDTVLIISKFYGLLNDNGYLCIVDLDEEDGSFHKAEPGFDGHNGFDQKKLESILEDAGFESIESKTFYYDEKITEGKSISYSLFLMKARKYNK